MITSKESYKYYLKCDCIANGFDYRRIRFPMFHHEIRFLKILRKCEYYFNCKKSFLYWPYKAFLYLRLEHARVKYGWHIPLNVCAEGLSLGHYGSIIINSHAKIGRFCRIHVGACIATRAGKLDECPVIGDYVYIGPGAKIFGPVVIGDESAIGANAVVTKSFEEGHVVLTGIPAKVKRRLEVNNYVNRDT
ncbi:MAG: hypothetical protein IKR23_12235 [Lachnospiraceae bacterium]|nr:hypothetical protein [Lachnospiraceae bacterium]